MATTRCQRLNIVGTHTLTERVLGRLHQGLGLRAGLKHARAGAVAPSLGAASRFRPGDWVRVASAESVRRSLDEKNRLRGLVFVPQQWETCGGTYRISHAMRRIVDDRGRFRAVSRTVLLDGVTCEGTSGNGGCGRACPLMFRDEWLEPAQAPCGAAPPPPSLEDRAYVRVRSLPEIEATLDRHRTRDGLMFMPEMAAYAGDRLRIVRRVDRVFEYDRYTTPPRPLLLLEGAQCTGAIHGERGPCDRRCTLVWHEDWVEPA